MPRAPRQAATEPAEAIVGDYRAIRAAEAAADTERINEILRLAGVSRASDPTGMVALRAQNALDAVARRGSATTAAELADAEDAIESARSALLAKLRGETFGAARALQAEILLESAEDLLLRRLAAPALDAMVAVGLPSDEEFETALGISASVRARLADPMLENPTPKDPTPKEPGDGARIYRARVLRGLSALLEHDLARLGPGTPTNEAIAAARSRARAALEEVAASTKAAEGTLSEILALAQARTTADSARRATLLAMAARSEDAATALVARVELWRDAGLKGEAPRAGSGADLLSQLSLAAEVRARADAGGHSAAAEAAIEAAIERWIDGAGHGAVEIAAVRTARALAARPIAETSPPTLTALHLLLRRDAAAPLPRAALLAAARDARVGPSVALRVAETLLRAGDADGAASLILESIERFDALPSARAALEIALEVRRLRALAALSTQGVAARGAASPEDAALAEALRVACSRFEVDAATPIWNAERAIIEDGGRAVETRSLEAAPPWLVRALAAREELIAAESARASGDEGFALARLESALALLASAADAVAAHTHAERRVAILAALRWLDLAASSDTEREAPAAIAVLARVAPPVGAHARALLPLLVERAARAFDRCRPYERPRTSPAMLAAFTALADMDARASDGNARVATARIYLELLAGEDASAAAAARNALARAPGNRPLQWALAESLRRAGTREAIAESFAAFRTLAPISAAERDSWWWRGQLGQLEILSDAAATRESQRADIVARLNQLASLDPALGGEALRTRFEALRTGRREGSEGAEP